MVQALFYAARATTFNQLTASGRMASQSATPAGLWCFSSTFEASFYCFGLSNSPAHQHCCRLIFKYSVVWPLQLWLLLVDCFVFPQSFSGIHILNLRYMPPLQLHFLQWMDAVAVFSPRFFGNEGDSPLPNPIL